MGLISRRLFLKSTPAALAVGTAVAAPAVIEAGHAVTSQLTAIPTDVYDAIAAWQTAHRDHCRLSRVYADALRKSPIDKSECDRIFTEMIHAEKAVGPARQKMIVALLTI